MGKIISKNGVFSFEEVKRVIPPSLDEFQTNAFTFCHFWLNGRDSFSIMTSGSTGSPKKITLSKFQMESSARASIKFFGLQKGDTILVCINTSYIGGMMMLVRALIADLDIVLVPPNSSPFSEISENIKTNFASFVPLQVQSIIEEQNPSHINRMNSMKSILIGGASVSGQLEDKIQSISTPIYSSYGMTETASHIALRRLNGEYKQVNYFTLPNIEISTDQYKCLKIKGEITLGNWIQTNDVVEILNPSEFKWIGRIDNVINSGGIKLHPEKIEESIISLMKKEGFNNFFIGKLPHPKLGEAPVLFIDGKKTGGKNELLENIKKIVGKYETPKSIIYINTFYKSETGKILKNKIQSEYERYFINVS